MKKWLAVVLLIAGIFLVGAGAFGLLERNQHQEGDLVSPLIDGETNEVARQFLKRVDEATEELKIWEPKTELKKNPPAVRAKAAVVVDFKTDKIILAKNLHQKLPIASLTKIMTAIMVLEYADLEQEVVVSAKAAHVGEAFMGLEAGEKLKLIDLLYGLLLPSGNDAAEVMAEGLAGRNEVFVYLMNKKAAELGLEKTEFVNPTGLDEDEGKVSQSTAYGLAILSHYAWTNFEKFREIVGTKEWEIPKTSEHKSYYLENALGLDETYPGMKGIKPGNTWEAGYCLLGLAEKDGREILVVLLDSPSPKNEVVELFDWAFGK